MKPNLTKTKKLIISKFRTQTLTLCDLVLEGETLAVSDSLLDDIQEFIRNLTSFAVRLMGNVWHANNVFCTEYILIACFRFYCLPKLKYCASSWLSAAPTYFGLLDGVFRRVRNCVDGNCVIWNIADKSFTYACCS